MGCLSLSDTFASTRENRIRIRNNESIRIIPVCERPSSNNAPVHSRDDATTVNHVVTGERLLSTSTPRPACTWTWLIDDGRLYWKRTGGEEAREITVSPASASACHRISLFADRTMEFLRVERQFGRGFPTKKAGAQRDADQRWKRRGQRDCTRYIDVSKLPSAHFSPGYREDLALLVECSEECGCDVFVNENENEKQWCVWIMKWYND